MRKVILDTDPGVDDAMALLFLHRHPDIDLRGITTVFGNVSVDLTTRNALYLKREFGIAAPVARGAHRPFDPSRAEPAWPTHVHGRNGLGDIALPDVVDGVALDERSAADFIVETVKADPGEITIVAVGRMTNLANALTIAPEIAGSVREIVIMGGSFYVPGNTTPVAEANIQGDPEAADAVMTAPWKVVVVGLDVTRQTVMTRTAMRRIAAKGGPATVLLNELSQSYIDFYGHLVEDAMLVHDSCACVYVVASQLFDVREGAVRVACGGLADGQTMLKPDGLQFGASAWDGMPSQTVCLGVRADEVLKLIEDTIGVPDEVGGAKQHREA